VIDVSQLEGETVMQQDTEAKWNAKFEALAARVVAQETELANLRALLSRSGGAARRGPSTRRDLLIGGAVITAAFMPAAAQANVRAKATTIDSSKQTGVIAAPGVDPDTLLPALRSTKHGVVGMADGKGPAPDQSSGVLGVGRATVGVQGLSLRSIGVYGESARTATPGVMAFNGAAGGIALGARASGNNGVAGQFDGEVQITGDLTVSGDLAVTGIKSAVLPHPDGSRRLVYCLEAPEAWLEDFGEGTLTQGGARVALDADFAAVCQPGSYHIFLTAHGDHHLHVAARDAGGFSVAADRELAALKGKRAEELQGTFSWRVVGRRKDSPGERLAKFPASDRQ
jgi:hypothetical protein